MKSRGKPPHSQSACGARPSLFLAELEDLAIRGDSIIYELINCLGPRIQRIFVYEEAHKVR